MPFLRTIATNLIRPYAKVIKGHRNLHFTVYKGLSDDEIESRFLNYFNKPDLDGWEVRQGVNEFFAFDMVPSPEICTSVLYACRRINEYSMCVRFLEAVKHKCGNKADEIYPYIIQEISPVLCELGIDTPEELGYDKPELCLTSVDDIH